MIYLVLLVATVFVHRSQAFQFEFLLDQDSDTSQKAVKLANVFIS